MKRSFLTVLAASTAIALAACGGPDTDADIEPVEEVQPPPPAPMPAPMDTTMMMDTLADTLPATPGM
jgi:hypothetical protein